MPHLSYVGNINAYFGQKPHFGQINHFLQKMGRLNLFIFWTLTLLKRSEKSNEAILQN